MVNPASRNLQLQVRRVLLRSGRNKLQDLQTFRECADLYWQVNYQKHYPEAPIAGGFYPWSALLWMSVQQAESTWILCMTAGSISSLPLRTKAK